MDGLGVDPSVNLRLSVATRVVQLRSPRDFGKSWEIVLVLLLCTKPVPGE